MDKYRRGIGYAAGNMMIKWNTITDHLSRNNMVITEDDTVNIYISFESILNNIIQFKNLNSIINNHKQSFILELESAVFNLIGHYKSYFNRIKCKCKVLIYHTTFKSDTRYMSIYNEFYREYYENTFTQNPMYSKVGKILSDTIIPEIKLITSYIRDCYFIETETFDASIIPKVLSDIDGSKSIIITSDIFDTLYMFEYNTCVFYLERKFMDVKIITDIDSMISHLVPNDNIFDMTVFRSPMHYQLLLSMKGNVNRNIKPVTGVVYNKFMDVIKTKILTDVILREVMSLDSILELFPVKYHKMIKNSFQMMSIDTQYLLLSDTDRLFIESQIIDKIDDESLNMLNNRRFLDFPINLQLLL